MLRTNPVWLIGTSATRHLIVGVGWAWLFVVWIDATWGQGFSAPAQTTSPWGGFPVEEPVSYQPAAGNSYPTAALESPWSPIVAGQRSDVPSAGTTMPGSVKFDPAIRLAEAPSLPQESPLLLQEEEEAAADSLLPPGTRTGVFQKIKFSATWLPQLENDSLGFSNLNVEAVFGLPLITRETPLVITPGYRVGYLERPLTPDLPSRLHDASVQFRHFRRLGERWIVDMATTLGVYADDHSFDASDAFRITGRALLVYENGEWKWIMGVAYLNRAGATVVPVAGVAYRTDTVQYELVFPRPRAAWLLPGSVKDVDERWVYIMGEFGGGVWAINRPATDTPDTLTARDYRILFGYERKITGGLSRRVEAGYVFGRELEFGSATPDVSLDDTFLMRVGLTY